MVRTRGGKQTRNDKLEIRDNDETDGAEDIVGENEVSRLDGRREEEKDESEEGGVGGSLDGRREEEKDDREVGEKEGIEEKTEEGEKEGIEEKTGEGEKEKSEEGEKENSSEKTGEGEKENSSDDPSEKTEEGEKENSFQKSEGGREEGDKENSDKEEEKLEEEVESGRGDEDEGIEEESDRSLETTASDEEESRSLGWSNSSDSEDKMIEPPLQPLKMHFHPSEYMKKIKLATRCFIAEALETLNGLENPLTSDERKWFEEHPQFKHIFHMPREKNHMLMGMWMLLLRTACTEKKKEAWFVANGTPIRYGIQEHALISGLNCRNYPVNYKKKGSEAFVKKHFKGMKNIRYEDVKSKLREMVPDCSRDRLKMAVLFFLSSIVIAQTKTGKDATPVEPFFLRAVDDLNLCKRFPWGRLSFDHMIQEIEHTMAHFDETVKGTLWPIPAFSI